MVYYGSGRAGRAAGVRRGTGILGTRYLLGTSLSIQVLNTPARQYSSLEYHPLPSIQSIQISEYQDFPGP